MPDARQTLVCGTIKCFDAEKAECSRCGAAIWPTTGSLIRARKENIPMICIDCGLATLQDATFGGLMDHGRILPEEDVSGIFSDIEAFIRSKGK